MFDRLRRSAMPPKKLLLLLDEAAEGRPREQEEGVGGSVEPVRSPPLQSSAAPTCIATPTIPARYVGLVAELAVVVDVARKSIIPSANKTVGRLPKIHPTKRRVIDIQRNIRLRRISTIFVRVTTRRRLSRSAAERCRRRRCRRPSTIRPHSDPTPIFFLSSSLSSPPGYHYAILSHARFQPTSTSFLISIIIL